MIELAVASILSCIIFPIIGWLLTPDKKVHLDDVPQYKAKELDIPEGTDGSSFKTLGQTFDGRWTNLFRPWGGIFGD